ncbi:Oxo-4-hydroxy-4-carboxy-5-ureidoimidazoline decarboxylase [Dipodascopsis tothii]|uniref:Oxo-4-hydroxy-4-carboxy-5-ureidoimidazoline decarboxylase n=1 Tax=Dipodascopsis tothii TaxID=44089 RepID=UPI0034CE30F9
MAYVLPSPAAFTALSAADRGTALTHLFEDSAALRALVVPLFDGASSYDDVIDRTRVALTDLAAAAAPGTDAQARLFEILAAHPRLGARKVESVHSQAEQASLQGEGEALAALNAEYEAAFPGLRYVVFVNGRPRDVIMANMRARIDRGAFDLEVAEAIDAMCAIAGDRARKLGA